MSDIHSTKKCGNCGVEKSFSEFNKNKDGAYGLHSLCKPCKKSRKLDWIRRNKAKCDDQKKIYYEANKEAISQQRKVKRTASREQFLARGRKYYLENKEKVNRKTRAHYQSNKSLYFALAAKRRACELRATPAWSCLSAIRDFYTAAQMFKIYTGLEYHVDHIVPLQSKKVCGLHVPANLQVLEAGENLAKSNTKWPDMW